MLQWLLKSKWGLLVQQHTGTSSYWAEKVFSAGYFDQRAQITLLMDTVCTGPYSFVRRHIERASNSCAKWWESAKFKIHSTSAQTSIFLVVWGVYPFTRQRKEKKSTGLNQIQIPGRDIITPCGASHQVFMAFPKNGISVLMEDKRTRD